MAEKKAGMSKAAATLIINRHNSGHPVKALVLQEAVRVLTKGRASARLYLPDLPAYERARVNMTLMLNIGIAIGKAQSTKVQGQEAEAA